MVAYMNDTRGQGRSQELHVVKGTATSTGFEPASLDAIAVVYALSFFDNREAMLKSIHDSLKTSGVLLVVDLPSEQVGARMVGIDADDLIPLASAAGFHAKVKTAWCPGTTRLSSGRSKDDRG